MRSNFLSKRLFLKVPAYKQEGDNKDRERQDRKNSEGGESDGRVEYGYYLVKIPVCSLDESFYVRVIS